MYKEFSNISVATSPNMSIGSWKTHGNLSIPSSPGYNKIDTNILVIPAKDVSEKESYLLSFGSFWQNIFQIPHRSPPLQVTNAERTHLELDQTGRRDAYLRHPEPVESGDLFTRLVGWA